MYRKELFKKAAGVTIACLLTIGLNAALSDTPKENVGSGADSAREVVITTLDSAEEEIVKISAEPVEPMAAPNMQDAPSIVAETAGDAPALPKAVFTAAPAAAGTAAPAAETAAPAETAAAPVSEAANGTASQEASGKYQNTGISIAKDYVNIRKNPSLNGKIKGKLYRGSAAKILKTKGSWVKVSSGSVTGYIKKEYLAIGEKAEKVADKFAKVYATVKKGTETLNVRQEKSTEADIVTQLDDGDSCIVKDEGEGTDWVKIKVNGSGTGYVAREYVSTKLRFGKAVSIQEEQADSSAASTVSDLGSSVASYALQFVGNPYVWGGSSLTNGADCSGFTMSVYAHFGYGLPHSSAAQAGYGRAVSMSELQPGDLIFYKHGGSIGHVAMYIGGGSVVHAQCERTGITTSSLYYNTPACARRIIG